MNTEETRTRKRGNRFFHFVIYAIICFAILTNLSDYYQKSTVYESKYASNLYKKHIKEIEIVMSEISNKTGVIPYPALHYHNTTTFKISDCRTQLHILSSYNFSILILPDVIRLKNVNFIDYFLNKKKLLSSVNDLLACIQNESENKFK